MTVLIEARASVDVLADLRGALDALSALDPAVLRDGATLLGLLREASRLEALVCRQSASFARGEEWACAGAQNAAAWVTTHARCTRTQARQRIRLGHAITWMHLVHDAFMAGRIGSDHVDGLAKARARSRATAIAFGRDQAMLVGWAESMTFHNFSHALDEWLEHADAHAAERRATKQFRQRRFHLSQSFENAWFADGVLDPISGQIIHEVLERIERELFRAEWADTRRRLGREPLVGELSTTAPQRRVDALVEMARRAATAPANGKRPAPLFTVLLGVDAFRRTCELAAGTVLSPGTAARWVDQALIERVVFDGPDRVLAVGRQRAFTGALRRAIEVRDRTCVDPYCDEPAEHCEIDHIAPWALGGETTLENGTPRCAFHNRLRTPDSLRHVPRPEERPRVAGS